MASHGANRELYLQMVEGRSDLDGRFTNIRRIGTFGGAGHFSLMFSALDQQSGRRVALKFFHPEKRNDGYRLDCFEREASILELLTGERRVIPLVAPKSGFVEALTTPLPVPFQLSFDYFAMDLASRDLRMVIDEDKWPAERRLVAFREICRAVERIHCLEIAHRDLKPGNCLVMKKGRIKLSDFGTARHFDGAAQALLPAYGAPVGDLRYAAPELLAALHDVEPTLAFASDFFALGAILYELFTGRILGDELFSDPNFVQGLSTISLVNQGDRLRIYEQLLPLIVGHELPSVAVVPPIAPDLVIERIDNLYRSMASLDYRDGKRLKDFLSIHRQINMCLLMLRNHQKSVLQQRELARKEEWRRARLLRLERRSLRVLQGGPAQ